MTCEWNEASGKFFILHSSDGDAGFFGTAANCPAFFKIDPTTGLEAHTYICQDTATLHIQLLSKGANLYAITNLADKIRVIIVDNNLDHVKSFEFEVGESVTKGIFFEYGAFYNDILIFPWLTADNGVIILKIYPEDANPINTMDMC